MQEKDIKAIQKHEENAETEGENTTIHKVLAVDDKRIKYEKKTLEIKT